MRIGIDARLYGTQDTGIGRYVQNLIQNLGRVDRKNTYIIFGHKKIIPDIEKFSNFNFVHLDTPIYSLKEQLINPLVFKKAKLDLLHVPHFNAPIFYGGKLIITIHDLIKHLSTGPQTTTHSSGLYLVKRLAYLLVVSLNISKATSILTPSNYWKNYLNTKMKVPLSKIFVTYEAPNKAFIPRVAMSDSAPTTINKPYLIYVGNLYPHKNVPFIISAIKKFNKSHRHQIQLALVCARSSFSKKIKTDDTIKILHHLNDTQLVNYISHALALVQPSLIEGFGLTGLEAMSLGVPVISSNATCLPEIYDTAAIYFDPHDDVNFIQVLKRLISHPSDRAELIKKGLARAKRFSWYKTAKETYAVYKQCVSH